MEPDPHEIFYQQRRDNDDVSLNIIDVSRSYENAPPASMDSKSFSFETHSEKESLARSCDDASRSCIDFPGSSSHGTAGYNSQPPIDMETNQRAPTPTPRNRDEEVGRGHLEGQPYPNYSLVQVPSFQRNPTPDPIRYFPMLVLANLFFIIGSGAFTWMAWIEDYKGNKHPAAISQEDNYETKETNEELVPEGYHLHLSTSLDTWITKEMISILVATFFFLQAGIVNLVRSWHFFNLCQILAGLCGLVSAMFWETKMLLSDIFYFLFVHAMMLQAVLSLHTQYLSMIRPHLDELKRENQRTSTPVSGPSHNQAQFLPPRRRRNVEGHFVFESSRNLAQNPSGLCPPSDDESDVSRGIGHLNDSGGNCFSIENSLSFEENGPPLASPTKGPDEYDSSILHNKIFSSGAGPVVTRFKYGIAYCIADSLFVLGSILEVALTYIVIFLLSGDAHVSTPNNTTNTTNENQMGQGTDHESSSFWRDIATALKLVPGILWGVCAIVTLVTSVVFQVHAVRGKRETLPPQNHSNEGW